MPSTLITNAIISAFCLCSHCCSPTNGGLAANGRPPVQGITVAGPRAYPLESVVTIYFDRERRREHWQRLDTAQVYRLQDRTATKYDGRWDIYFRSHQQAKSFGIKHATVKVTTPPNNK